jgi:deoxyribonuclease V
VLQGKALVVLTIYKYLLIKGLRKPKNAEITEDMRIGNLHHWKLSYKEAVRLQKQLAGEVRFSPLKKPLRFVAGLDCAFTKDGQRIIAAVVVLKLPAFEVAEIQSAVCHLAFPYIPGLLSFREAPACLKAVEKLKTIPDLFIVDGQGIAHPRRLGIASHLGLFFDRPTIGCAKSRLIGVYKEPPLQKGAFAFLRDKSITSDQQRASRDEVIGAVVRTRTAVKPVFVSVGHKFTLDDAIEAILTCANKYRLPEPTRLAHGIVSRLKLEK